MTLTKTKTPRRTTAARRKRAGAHHRKGHNYKSAYWPYLPIIAIITIGVVLNSWLGAVHRSVLGYATDMSASSLLAGTNQQRAANGLGALAINATLNQAAQAKANDMVVNDYWAHTSPTGVTPWYWFSNVGYSYQTAGENLAYGFTSSSDTITGWMNSPGHKANILNGSFQEVGFGIVNAPNYQGNGPQTIVVALYAQPAIQVAPAPVAASTPSTTAPTSRQTTPQQSQTPAAVPLPSTTANPVPAESDQTPSAQESPVEPLAESAPSTTRSAPVATASSAGGIRSEDSQKVTRIATLSATNASWSGFAISMIASVALLAFLLRHSFAWHKAIVKGEKFILNHPIIDIVFVGVATLGFVLTQTSGLIK